MLLRAAVVLLSVVVAFSARSPAYGEPYRLRVLSYNIHHGEGTDGKLDLERIATVIRGVEPDVVALQEVDRGTRRTNQVDQPAELGRLTGMQAIFESNFEFDGGDYGNAVLTRLPAVAHKNHHLPSYYQGEQRGVLAVELRFPDGGPEFLFLATHLDYRPNDTERRASAAMINKLVEKRSDLPALLAGDLNALPDTKVLHDFDAVWERANPKPLLTFPSRKPVRQIDYVLYRPPGRWRVIEARIIDEPVASDHRPVLAVFEFVAD